MRYISIIFLVILFIACKSNEPKTFITEKPLVLDTSNFVTIRQKFNYRIIDSPSQILGGLTPKVPLAEVTSFDFKDNYLWTSHGMIMTCNSLVAKIHDTLCLIDTEQKFKEIFVPIDNEQEAISYVSYLSRAYPKYDIVKKFRYRVYSSHFPSTYSKRISGGFEVLLHDKKVYGCGPHPYTYKLFKVTYAGQITMLQDVKMFEDPEEDALCVD